MFRGKAVKDLKVRLIRIVVDRVVVGHNVFDLLVEIVPDPEIVTPICVLLGSEVDFPGQESPVLAKTSQRKKTSHEQT
eukprot:2670299-Amphidinium_carterae.1